MKYKTGSNDLLLSLPTETAEGPELHIKNSLSRWNFWLQLHSLQYNYLRGTFWLTEFQITWQKDEMSVWPQSGINWIGCTFGHRLAPLLRLRLVSISVKYQASKWRTYIWTQRWDPRSFFRMKIQSKTETAVWSCTEVHLNHKHCSEITCALPTGHGRRPGHRAATRQAAFL